MVGDYTMKKHIIIAPEFAIDSSIIKSIREKITGICSSTKLQITLDEISHSEAENVIQYLNSIGKFKVILDEDYYSSEELLNFDYFYCSGIASRFVRNFSEKSHSNQAAFCSFSKSIFCSRRVSALM